MEAKDWVLLVLGTGGVAAWAKPLKDLITTSSRSRQVKTKDMVTALNQSRQRADDENAYLRELAGYWQGYAADVVFTARQNGLNVPTAHPPERRKSPE